MAESHEDKQARALAAYMSLSKAVNSLDILLDGHAGTHYGLSSSQYRVLEHLLLFGPMATGSLARRFSSATARSA